jgi:hypothetical protein
MKRKLSTLVLIFTLSGLTYAGDTKLDLTGTWKWTAPANPDGQIPITTFTLKLQGQTVTGTITKTASTNTISNGVLKGNEVSFQVVSEGHSGKSTTAYNGKLTGDTIKGKLEMHVRDKILSSDWEIRRIEQ